MGLPSCFLSTPKTHTQPQAHIDIDGVWPTSLAGGEARWHQVRMWRNLKRSENVGQEGYKYITYLSTHPAVFVECRGMWEWWKARSTVLVTVDLDSNSDLIIENQGQVTRK